MELIKLGKEDKIINSGKEVLVVTKDKEWKIARIIRNISYGVVGRTKWALIKNITHYAVLEIPKKKPSVSMDVVKDLVEYWNSKRIKIKKVISPKLKSAINTLLKTYTVEQAKESMDNYHGILIDDECFYTHKFELTAFIKQANGMEKFLDETVENTPKVNNNAKPDIEKEVYEEPKLDMEA